MKAIIFDRDGTILEFIDFLHKTNDVVINKDILPILKYLLLQDNLKFFSHKPIWGMQRIFKLTDVKECNKLMLDILENTYCKFVPEKIYIATTFDSPYRKPSNNVAKEIKKKFDIEEKILYIGDTMADYQTAKQSNCKCIIYRVMLLNHIKKV